MDQNALQQIIDRLKEANNVLVTVSTNPSVDQLSACIGITLLLNHLNKHATAVFSGTVPSTIEFLKPDDTLEKNTDSLRDFIIALDKSKADKLRYKVEDKVVKIFITPYRTSISDKDLDFSQGDFNVDVVLALGVHDRADLDKAIMDHGRILHDATVISVNNKDQGNLGAINWVNLNASSLAEMMVEMAHGLTTDALDGQMATAFMTGIVAETARFSNDKTSPRTMSLASELMGAGANQQLIASKLDAAQPIQPKSDDSVAPASDETPAENVDGSLQISHDENAPDSNTPEQPKEESPQPTDSNSSIDDLFDGLTNPSTDTPPPLPPTTPATDEAPASPLPPLPDEPAASEPLPTTPITGVTNRNEPSLPQTPAGMPNRPSMALDPPSLGGQLTANSQPEHLQSDVSIDPLSLPAVDSTPNQPPLLNRPIDLDGKPIQPTTPEKGEEIEDARDAVSDAIASEPPQRALDPIEALGAQPVNLDLRADTSMPPLPPAPTGINSSPTPQPSSLPSFDQPAPAPLPLPPAPTPAPEPPMNPLPPLPGEPAPDPSQPPAMGASPFGAPPDMNGVNPNLPTNLLPPSQPIDSTASNGSPSAPPPVPPPLMPPPQQ